MYNQTIYLDNNATTKIDDEVLTTMLPFLKENYGNHSFDLERILSTLVVNIIMRIIGFVIRAIILSVAFVCIVGTAILIPFIFVIWLALPVLLPLLIGGSVWGYIKYK